MLYMLYMLYMIYVIPSVFSVKLLYCSRLLPGRWFFTGLNVSFLPPKRRRNILDWVYGMVMEMPEYLLSWLLSRLGMVAPTLRDKEREKAAAQQALMSYTPETPDAAYERAGQCLRRID
jgi:hypothetical protein